MKVRIKYLDKIQEFSNKSTIVIGNNDSCDFIVEDINNGAIIKLVYTQKYNNYVLINSTNTKDALFNNKVFSKVLVPANFTVNVGDIPDSITVQVESAPQAVQIQNSTNNAISSSQFNM